MGKGGVLARQESIRRACRVLVVDDSAVARGIIKKILEEEAGIEVVATAINGEQAIRVAEKTRPDLVILDIEMPVLGGMEALPKLLELGHGPKVIIASGLAERAAKLSLEALKIGASDFVVKPSSGLGGAAAFRDDLVSKVRVHSRGGRSVMRSRPSLSQSRPAQKDEPRSATPREKRHTSLRPEIIAIGSSTGGPQALTEVLRFIGPRVTQPILITQHMPPNFTALLADQLGKVSGRPTKEACDGDVIEEGKTYLAPGGRHMIVEAKAAGGALLRLTDDPPENSCRPAVDPMLRSIARVYGDRVLVTILTGMGVDGMKGCESIVDAGGTVFAQDMETSVVWGMPGAVASAGLAHSILPIGKVGPAIARVAGGAM